MSHDLLNLCLDFKGCPTPTRAGVLECLIMIVTALSPSLFQSEFKPFEIEKVAEMAQSWESESQDPQISDLVFSLLNQLKTRIFND